jgi:ketosteroid isomerase-like protein
MKRILLPAILMLGLGASALAQSSPARESADRKILLARANEWTDTWNKRDLKRMRALHAPDIDRQLYGIGGNFGSVKKLFEDIEKTNFFGLRWTLKMVDPKIRMLGSDSALIALRLVGKETNSKGVSRDFAEGFTLVFQRIKKDWKIVHVHDSSRM